jgi:hypothetical protein
LRGDRKISVHYAGGRKRFTAIKIKGGKEEKNLQSEKSAMLSPTNGVYIGSVKAVSENGSPVLTNKYRINI